ncbi:hypothetical protein CNR22_17130 [Sphingobacteriaceae bacterium]|nr:hypothetical protein CNR22_17130 [Sphingobacteriaceae bacterium]
MSAKTIFTLEHTLPDHFDLVYASLFDFKKFGEIHPFMTEVKLLDEKPEYREYKIVEEIYFFGFIKNNPTYTAKVIEIEKGKHIRYTSPVKKNIFLTVDIRFSKDKTKNLIVTENFEVTANRLIGMVFANILKKAHLQFFKNLKVFLHTSIEDIKTH